MTVEYVPERRIFHAFVPCVMGTKLDFFICGRQESDSRSLWDGFYSITEELDRLLNRFDPKSELSRINASVPFTGLSISDGLAVLLKLSSEYYTKSKGAFDVSLGSGKELSLDGENRLTLKSGMLDFGGFAKGYALRICKRMLETAGVSSAFVNFGNSSILAVGSHPFGDAWKVDVIDPYNNSTLATLRLNDRSMSTSGNTPGYSGHILKLPAGERIYDRKLAVAVSDDPLDAEVLSTVAMACDARGFASGLHNAEYRIFEL